MRSLVLLLTLLVGTVAEAQTYTPDDVVKAAAKDLTERVPPEKRRIVRYLDLHAVPKKDKKEFIDALRFAINSTSLRTNVVNPVVIPVGGEPLLMRIDLEDAGWDKNTRSDKLKTLEKFNVKFDIDAKKRDAFLDVWEQFANDDPFFFVTTEGSRGWIDPEIELSVRNLTYSRKFVVRADWLLPRLLLEKKFDGYYSDLLMLHPKEADLYRAFGVDEKFVDANNQLKQGGGVLSSIVALNNRELQIIPSYFGIDEKFIWRTFDFKKSGRADKSVIQTFAGHVKLDGREIIGSLPNGLHWYYLADAEGNQVADVPPDIAQDKRQADFDIKDRRVINAYKCISCHGEANGIYPFQDVILKAMLNPKIALTVLNKDKEKAGQTRQLLEEYYNSKLGRSIKRQQESYVDRVKDCNGLESSKNSQKLVYFVERYIHNPVTPEDAAREMGVDLPTAEDHWKNSGNGVLAVLLSGTEVPRRDWEDAFTDAMRAAVYPWEGTNKR